MREKDSRHKAVVKDMEMIEHNIGAWLAKQAAINYPWVSVSLGFSVFISLQSSLRAYNLRSCYWSAI